MIKINWATKYLYHLSSLYTFAMTLCLKSMYTRNIIFEYFRYCMCIWYVCFWVDFVSVLSKNSSKLYGWPGGRLPFTRVPKKSTHGRRPSKEKHRLNTVGRYLCNGSNDFLFHHVNLVESRIIGPFTGFEIHGKLLEILIGGNRPKKHLPRNDRNWSKPHW